jgi:hypothetical protein
MAVTSKTPHVSKSAQIRASLNHPIIDSDGHTLENPLALAEYIKSVRLHEQVSALRTDF